MEFNGLVMTSNNTVLVVALSAVSVASLAVYLMGGFTSKSKSAETSSNGKKTKEKSAPVDDSAKYPAGNISIFFGSQTGTAEGFARQLVNEGKAKGFNAKSMDLEEFSPEKLAATDRAVFLMATYGEGEPTDNAINFYKWLKNSDKEIDDNYLANLKYTVFGLGNRQYEHFNAMGKAVDKLLPKLGAKVLFEYGEGDDDGSLEEDFDNWKTKFWASVLTQFHPSHKDGSVHIASAADEVVYSKVELQYDIEYLDTNNSAKMNQNPITSNTLLAKANSSTRHYFTAVHSKVAINRELRNVNNNTPRYTETDIGSTRHIELSLTENGLKYHTADNLAVIPLNTTTAVESIARHLGYNLDQYINLIPSNNIPADEFKYMFPTPCTIREILSTYVDLHGVPKHANLSYLLPYVQDKEQKTWLSNLLSKDNRKLFHDTIEGSGRCIYDLFLKELSSCQIPLADFLHIVPSQQPRYYTISSSSSVHPNHVHITVSVTNTKVTSGAIVPGLCSTYLRQLELGTPCKIFIRASSFKLPTSLKTPIIMIGPGTGIAPMRALIQERAYQYEQQSKLSGGSGSGGDIRMSNVLYFGCKRSNEDFIYQDELRAHEKSGALTKLHLAFSREKSEKVYVQHLIKREENAKSFIQDLDMGGYIYVCGATAMGEDVNHAIIDIIQSYKGLTKEETEKYVKNLQATGRYVQELWTA